MRFPFHHPQIEAVLKRQHAAAAADKWKLIPRLPRYAWARLRNRLGERTVQQRIFFNVYSAVTPERGALIYLLARAVRARRVVEFGSSFGISTIYLATAVRDNFPGAQDPAGQVTGSEMEPHKIAEAAKNIEAAGLSDIAAILPGDARETLPAVEGPLDLAFLDGRKDLYLPVLKLLEPKLRPGAVVLSDNMDSFRGEVAEFREYVQSGKNGFASATIGISDGIELSVFQGRAR
ncbi:MAG TPA: class I SAM-dependent methyltransferase [Verrucomicrobiae bacterium]|nr:class I SAM-dependent methyltransferase [Verrucomicrobiae bacterium]